MKINNNAKKLNDTLGVDLFDINDIFRLKLKKFTKKEIKKMHIDDLIDIETKQATQRLAKLVKEILF